MFEFEVVNGATDAIAGTNSGLAYTDANTSKS